MSYGFHDDATAVHMHTALARRADVIPVGPGHSPSADAERSRIDGLVWVETHLNPSLPPAEDLLSLPSVGWMIDTHVETRWALGWRLRLSAAFDHTFTAQRDASLELRSRGLSASWLPLAAPAEHCGAGVIPRDRPYDVAFVGKALDGTPRAAMVSALRRQFEMPPDAGWVPPAEMMNVYRSARIVVNPPRGTDLNMRAFEGPGAGAFLVTGPMDGLEEVLPAGSYALVEDDEPGCWVEAVAQALQQVDLADRAAAAFRAVTGAHTYDHRADEVLRTIDRLDADEEGTRPRKLAALAAGAARYGQLDAIAVAGRGTRRWLARAERAFWVGRDWATKTTGLARRR